MSNAIESNGKPLINPSELDLIRGAPSELNILQYYVGSGLANPQDVAPRFRQLVEQNPDWSQYMYYSNSPSHFARIMVTLFADHFYAYSNLYRITASIHIGESSMKRNKTIAPPIDAVLPQGRSNVANEIQTIATDYEITTRMNQFTTDRTNLMRDLNELIGKSTTEIQRGAYQQTLSFFTTMDQLQIPGFRPDIHPRPYQARAILRNLHDGVVPEKTALGLFHGTRTGKTYTASARMRYLGVDKVLAIVPAGLRNLWYQEMHKYHQKPPKILVIESNPTDRVLTEAEDPETNFVFLSYELLARRFNLETGQDEFEEGMIKELADIGFKGLIADEVHTATGFRNRTATSEVLRRLSFMPSVRHIILATATPADRMRDMDLLVHILDPIRYPEPISFSKQLRSNPRLGHNALLLLMDRVKTDEALEDLPPFTEEVVRVELTPTQRAIYDFILRNENMHPFSKLINLVAATTHQRLVRGLVLPYKKSQRSVELSAAYMKWRKETEKDPNITFDSDFLVTHGFTNLYLSALANLKGGISDLVTQTNTPTIIEAWQGESVPAKFVKIKDKIREKLAKREKVIVASSAFTQGITRDIEDLEKEQEIFESLLKYLQKEFGANNILKIDGEDDTKLNLILPNGDRISQRELIRRKWQKRRDEDKFYSILIINDRTSSQGIDLSIQDTSVTGVTMIIESLPMSLRKFIQLKSRIMSDTQLSPVTYVFMEGIGTPDGDIHWLLDQKLLPMDMLLDAVSLTDEEINILDSSPESIAGVLGRVLRSPRQNLARIFDSMKGKSAEENRRFLAQEFRSGETYEEYLAKYYDELYINGYSGNAIKVVKTVVENLIKMRQISDPKIADWGCGPLILARMLEQPVASLDISPLMLTVGKRKLDELGIDIDENLLNVGDFTSMSDKTFPRESFDIGVCSLALDCTSPGEERIRAIRRMGDSIKKDGLLVLTIPHAEMDAEDYQSFLESLKRLGFADDLSLSGSVRGKTNNVPVFNAWLFVLRKTGGAGEINPNNLLFEFEKPKSSRKRRQEANIQRMVKYRSDKSPEVEKFYIYEPLPNKTSDQWVEIGDLNDLTTDSLTRYLLDLSDGTLAYYGYKREIVLKNGKQEINLTRA